MKVIKISNCSECPYSEMQIQNDPNQKPLWVKENLSYYGRQKTITAYYCNENKGKYCGETIPEWCPLEELN